MFVESVVLFDSVYSFQYFVQIRVFKLGECDYQPITTKLYEILLKTATL